MIESLRGQVLRKGGESCVIECAGVGYGMLMSVQSLVSLPEEGEAAFVWVHTHLSQDALRLFGFTSREEMSAFKQLLAASGVGPKLALAILSTLSPDDLRAAVLAEDKGRLTKIPGVGKKKAERLILELRDRLGPVNATPSSASARPSIRSDVESALLNLGFNPKVVGTLVDEVLKEFADETNVAVLVKEALRASTAA